VNTRHDSRVSPILDDQAETNPKRQIDNSRRQALSNLVIESLRGGVVSEPQDSEITLDRSTQARYAQRIRGASCVGWGSNVGAFPPFKTAQEALMFQSTTISHSIVYLPFGVT
jgi:hypothetical protein